MLVYHYILVGGIPTPLKNDGVRQLGWWNFQYMEVIKVMFQTTNQTNMFKNSNFWILAHHTSTCWFIPGIVSGLYHVIPSGKRLHNYGKSQFLIGKSTISMVHFHVSLPDYKSLVGLPEGSSGFTNPSSGFSPLRSHCKIHQRPTHRSKRFVNEPWAVLTLW